MLVCGAVVRSVKILQWLVRVTGIGTQPVLRRADRYPTLEKDKVFRSSENPAQVALAAGTTQLPRVERKL